MAVGFACILSAVSLHAQVGRPLLTPSATELDSQVRLSPGIARALSFGYRALLADYNWIDGIQYYGSPENAQLHYRGLFDKLDRVTDLDPDFDYVYQFGGETIPFHEPSVNLWFNTKQSIALLGKGVEHHVQRWEVPWLLGYSLYAYWGRYADAGRAMTAAADLIDAVGQRAEARFAPPKYIRSLAVRLLAQGGDLETAIVATQLALAQSTDERARDELDQRLKSLVLQKDLDLLNRALEASTQSGQTIRNLGNLVRVGSLSSVPPDPFGGEFYIDAASKVRSTHESLLLKVYVHPGQQAIEPTAD